MTRRIIPYQKHLKERASELRNNSTESEIILWMHVKGKKLRGYDFHRQKPLSFYIVDFFCNELMLAIEIDGISHEDKQEQDDQRQRHLEEFGIRFLRFSDDEVKTKTQEVLLAIEKWIDEHTPNPSQEGNTHP